MLIPHNTFTPSFWVLINPKPPETQFTSEAMRKTVSLFKRKTGSWEEFPQTCAVYGHTSRLVGGLMLLEEPYSELAPKIPTRSADSLGAGMPGHGWVPQHLPPPGPAPQCAGRWSSNKGSPSQGKAGSCAPPSPLLVTVGPGRPEPDPTWVISAECEMGAGGWPRDHPLPPRCP